MFLTKKKQMNRLIKSIKSIKKYFENSINKKKADRNLNL